MNPPPPLPWPAIRVHFEGRLVIADCFKVVFFLNDSHSSYASALGAVLERLDAELGPGAFQHYIDEDGYDVPVTRRWFEELLGTMPTEPTMGLRILGPEMKVGGFELYYHGDRLPDPEWPGLRNLLWFRIPTETVVEKGIGAIRDLILRIAEMLPFSFAYGQPAIDYHPSCEFEALRATARYPGFDFLDPGYCKMEIGNQVPGVYWLSLFGKALSDSLGGIATLRASLPPDILVKPFGAGSVLVQLGTHPSVGDVNRDDALPLYRALAQVLRPILYIPGASYLAGEDGLPDEDGTRRWHLRFFTESGTPSP